ncbi:MAG TPA: cytochrome c [Bryobacteraceae bacterium]|nr:cytochrome c [Bryobacteraceae bacterium]
MQRLFLLVSFAAALAIPSLCQTGNAENGKRLFKRDGCYECHGYAGQGGAAGARIADIGLNAKGLIHYVRAPAGQMPAYKEQVISDQELTDVWAYLQTMPKAKPAKDIPLLNALKR